MLCPFYACSSFVFACIDQNPIPLSAAGLTLLLATLTTSIHSQRGWRRIFVIGLHLLGLSFAYLKLCHNYYRLESPFWSIRWLQDFFMHERTAASWPVLVLILLCIWILWFCGIRLSTRPTNQTTISHRFDAGLGFLFLLLLIKLIIAGKGVSIPAEHSVTRPVIAFIILGLFSMGFVHAGSPSQKGSITYSKGAGIAMTFTLTILMLGGGLFILFLPGLQTIAEAGYPLLGSVMEPLERIVIFLAKLYLKSGYRRQPEEAPTGEYMPTINQSEEELGFFHYLFAGFTIAIVLTMAGLILFYIVNWLRATTAEEKKRKGIWELLVLIIQAIKQLFYSLRERIPFNTDEFSAAKNIYLRLLRWGRFSGLGHIVCETPKEYAHRLGDRFPQIEKEILQIVHLHDEAIYGGILPDKQQIYRARLALRRIRNPLWWFARLKSLCFQNRF